MVVEVDGLPNPKQDIFKLTDHLRQQTLFNNGNEYAVSPNHILMPSPIQGWGCPFGPPLPASRYAPPPPPSHNGDRFPTVTVIDTGYQDWWSQPVKYPKWGETFGPWGENPLNDVCDLLEPKLAPWLKGTGRSLTPGRCDRATP